MITWKDLPTQEQFSLMSFDHTPQQAADEEITTSRTRLFLKGLLQKTSKDDYTFYSLTPIGGAVLAQAFDAFAEADTPHTPPAVATPAAGDGLALLERKVSDYESAIKDALKIVDSLWSPNDQSQVKRDYVAITEALNNIEAILQGELDFDDEVME